MECAKVLLVDHEQGEYEQLRQGLVRHGYEIHAVAKTPKALALASAHRYQAALVALPFIAETSFVSMLHTEHPELPLIVILPPLHTDCFSPAMMSVATNVIGKPLLLDAVRLILDRTLELVALRTQVRQNRQQWCVSSAVEMMQTDGNAPPAVPTMGIPLDTALAHKLRHIVPNLEMLGRGALHRAVLSYVERLLLNIVLSEFRGNQVRAAEILGINRNTLRKKIREFGLETHRGKG